MNNPTIINPTVLVMDDEPDELERLVEGFCENTSLGILPVGNLKDAAKLVKKAKRYHIRAIFADQRIANQFRSDSPRLANGVDLLSYASKKDSRLELYLHTVDGKDEHLRQTVRDELGTKVHVFAKGEARGAEQQPWACVERDYLAQALDDDTDFQNRVMEEGINLLEARDRVQGDQVMAERLRRIFDAHRITYIHTMGTEGHRNNLSFIEPIEAVCIKREDGSYSARALGLGVLEEGISPDSAWDALLDLTDRVVEVYLELGQEAENRQLEGYAKKVWGNLRAVIRGTE